MAIQSCRSFSEHVSITLSLLSLITVVFSGLLFLGHGTQHVAQQHHGSLLVCMQVEEKYTRMQILCMHRPRWRKDLIASQQKPATFARLLGVSHR